MVVAAKPIVLRKVATLVGGFLLLFSGGESIRAAEVSFTEGIEYACPDGNALRLNLARPETQHEPLPVIICIHGGGFARGHRSECDDLCRKLAARGYIAVTIDYRLSPQYKWPAHIYDCKAAVRWLRAVALEYQISPDRIGATGSSAGGHLVQFMAVTNDVREFDGDHTHLEQASRIACAAAWCQASDFTREYGIWKSAPAAFRDFLGASLTAETRRLHTRASPLFWVTPNAAPSLLVHGTNDREVLFAQSVWIYERLKSADVDVELVAVDGGGHGLPDQKHRQLAEEATFAFFDRHLRGAVHVESEPN